MKKMQGTMLGGELLVTGWYEKTSDEMDIGHDATEILCIAFSSKALSPHIQILT